MCIRDSDNAWMCYDQAQLHFPEIPTRDRFIERMESKMDDNVTTTWNAPGIESKVEFLSRMQTLASQAVPTTEVFFEDDNNPTMGEVDVLLSEERFTEAFFLARRMAAEGVEGAVEKVEEIRGML